MVVVMVVVGRGVGVGEHAEVAKSFGGGVTRCGQGTCVRVTRLVGGEKDAFGGVENHTPPPTSSL